MSSCVVQEFGVNAAKTLERDTFKSASEAQQFGLIDEVLEKRPIDHPVAK